MRKLSLSDEEKNELQRTIKQFKRRKTKEEKFYDLCFCLLAPQTTFKSNRATIFDLIALDFYHREISRKKLYKVLRRTRFFRVKTGYLLGLKKVFPEIVEELKRKKSAEAKREYLASNIKGMGLKAASHFLRNLGEEDLAVIDTHVMKFLGADHSQAKTKREYCEIEKEFRKVAKANRMTPAVLDAYIWKTYSGTPWSDFDR